MTFFQFRDPEPNVSQGCQKLPGKGLKTDGIGLSVPPFSGLVTNDIGSEG
ncbi:MAG: hypothetical protein CM1200mP14_27270 [Gammaproteobacteria bacterium]|nr:MAG: hypothetical protein CM1200mP14_27270 [Gammaproteobacteria bacterium]